MFRSRLAGQALGLILLFALVACKPTDSLTKSAFPEPARMEGWKTSQAAKTYKPDNLFDLVDGQAESFFAYGFEEVSVQHYLNGDDNNLVIEIWQLANPADAYGLFTYGRAGQPISIGNGGDTDPGTRLTFWQDRFFISINASQPLSGESLLAIGLSVSEGLPSNDIPPGITNTLPPEGLDPQSVIFFHEEISVQNQVWLGGENLLGLGQDTDCSLGRYSLDGVDVYLLIAEYPNARRAAAGLAALQNGNIAGAAAAGADGTRLGVVFGAVDENQAQALLNEALKGMDLSRPGNNRTRP